MTFMRDLGPYMIKVQMVVTEKKKTTAERQSKLYSTCHWVEGGGYMSKGSV